MLIILKVGLGLMGLLLLTMGGRWIFSLEKMMADTGISTTANIGRSNLRGDIGGLLITSGIAIFLFLFHGEVWALTIIGLMAAVILGRVVSLMADGKSKEGVIGIVVELITIALVIGISRFEGVTLRENP